MKGKGIVIPADKLVQVNCKADEGRQMIFNSSNEEILEGLQCANTVVYLRKSIKIYFKIELVNNCNHYIFLRKYTRIGHLDYVSSVISLENKTIEMSPNEVPEKYAVFANSYTSNLEEPQKPSEEHQHVVVKKTDLLAWAFDTWAKIKSEAIAIEIEMFFLSVMII